MVWTGRTGKHLVGQGVLTDIYNPPVSKYPSPLAGYENHQPLSDAVAEDGKSLVNAQTGVLSKAYDEFVDPLDRSERFGL